MRRGLLWIHVWRPPYPTRFFPCLLFPEKKKYPNREEGRKGGREEGRKGGREEEGGSRSRIGGDVSDVRAGERGRAGRRGHACCRGRAGRHGAVLIVGVPGSARCVRWQFQVLDGTGQIRSVGPQVSGVREYRRGSLGGCFYERGRCGCGREQLQCRRLGLRVRGGPFAGGEAAVDGADSERRDLKKTAKAIP